MTPLKASEAENTRGAPRGHVFMECALCVPEGTYTEMGTGMARSLAQSGYSVFSGSIPRRTEATYRWERDVRSRKEPSGTLEMSLPWRVLKRKHRPEVKPQVRF